MSEMNIVSWDCCGNSIPINVGYCPTCGTPFIYSPPPPTIRINYCVATSLINEFNIDPITYSESDKEKK